MDNAAIEQNTIFTVPSPQQMAWSSHAQMLPQSLGVGGEHAKRDPNTAQENYLFNYTMLLQELFVLLSKLHNWMLLRLFIPFKESKTHFKISSLVLALLFFLRGGKPSMDASLFLSHIHFWPMPQNENLLRLIYTTIFPPTKRQTGYRDLVSYRVGQTT